MNIINDLINFSLNQPVLVKDFLSHLVGDDGVEKVEIAKGPIFGYCIDISSSV
jgi:hypothetical protein